MYIFLGSLEALREFLLAILRRDLYWAKSKCLCEHPRGIDIFRRIADACLVTACKHNDDTRLVNVTGMTASIATSGRMCPGARLLAVEGKTKLFKLARRTISVVSATIRYSRHQSVMAMTLQIILKKRRRPPPRRPTRIRRGTLLLALVWAMNSAGKLFTPK